MANLLDLISRYWNNILIFSAGVGMLLMDFTVPPNFDSNIIESQINYLSFTKYIIATLFILALVPCTFFKEKKFTMVWWILALAILSLSVYSHFRYNTFLSKNIIRLPNTGKAILIGDKMYPFPDSIFKALSKADFSNSIIELVEGIGGEELVWSPESQSKTAQKVVLFYLLVVAAYSLTIIFGIQALYCLTRSSLETPTSGHN